MECFVVGRLGVSVTALLSVSFNITKCLYSRHRHGIFGHWRSL